jgi:hypothetical protein
MNRLFEGQAVSGFVAPVHLVTAENKQDPSRSLFLPAPIDPIHIGHGRRASRIRKYPPTTHAVELRRRLEAH